MSDNEDDEDTLPEGYTIDKLPYGIHRIANERLLTRRLGTLELGKKNWRSSTSGKSIHDLFKRYDDVPPSRPIGKSRRKEDRKREIVHAPYEKWCS